jgi:hypothetical protein
MSMQNHGGKISTRGKLLIYPPELSGNPTSSQLPSSKPGGTDKEMILSYEVCLSYFKGTFNMP